MEMKMRICSRLEFADGEEPAEGRARGVSVRFIRGCLWAGELLLVFVV
jgi:hypothetical protein